MLSLIVAVADGNAIGRENKLLWHISEDLKYFKKVTTGHPVIMGRKTYESIGRALPGRRNIVVSRKGCELGEVKNPDTTSLECAKSIEDAINIAKGEKDEFFVIGGGEIYKQTFEAADRLYITHIYASIDDADTFFPQISPQEWEIEHEGEYLHDDENDIDFEFIIYKRRTINE